MAGARPPVVADRLAGGGEPVVVEDGAAFDPAFAAAGVVAECLFDDQDLDASSVIDLWEADVIVPSPSDLSLRPEDWDERFEAVQAALDILRRHKPLFDRIVLELLEHKSLSDGQVLDRHDTPVV